MKIPLIFKKEFPNTQPYKYIFIHSSECIIDNHELMKLRKEDKNKDQLELLKYYWIIQKKNYDLPFHYIIQNVSDDYHVIQYKPIIYHSKYYDNMFKHNQEIIHVCLIGDYNIQMATPRLYDVLSYRLLIPLMYIYKIDLNRIFLHSEIEEKSKCPGDLFIKQVLYARIQKFLIHR